MSAPAIRNQIFKSMYKMEIYSKINPRLCDVSLRDGLQNADCKLYTTPIKEELFTQIMDRYRPHSIEVGSIISPKVLPILSDSISMFHYANRIKETVSMHKNANIFMLVPSMPKLITALNLNIQNISMITSVSNSFQLKNTHKTIDQTKEEFMRIRNLLEKHPSIYKKLYISCITKCPIEGKIDLDHIVNELIEYHSYDMFDELCISDTCGTMKYEEFRYVIDKLIEKGVSSNKLSLHLHVSDFNNTQQIIWYAFTNSINKFDVSDISTGGCSVTMNSSDIHSNLSYDDFYTILDNYINELLW